MILVGTACKYLYYLVRSTVRSIVARGGGGGSGQGPLLPYSYRDVKRKKERKEKENK